MGDKLKWNIDIKAIEDKDFDKWRGDYDGAVAQMQQRTRNYELYGLIAKNKSIHDWVANRAHSTGKYFSEGSSQYILRKALASTIQRVPDGELRTQYDKASVEHIQIDYIFNNKVLWSEFEGIDMLSNITSTFKASFIYGFCPVRTGFERDADGDVRINFSIENWADIFVNRDCRDIRRPQVVWHRAYMCKAEVEALLTEDGAAKDPTYEADTIKYVLDNKVFTGKQWESEKLGDKLQGSTALESLELLTKYVRGASEFVTYVPKLKAVFRRVKNEDPRKEIPWDFFVLEPDADFPLGFSQIELLLADQQFQDLFQTSAYKNLLLALEPPVMVGGWETNPASFRYEPRKIWNLGNNPNQAKVEPVKIENGILNSWLATREGVASGMMRQLNLMDGTISQDSHVPGFSGTAPGVEAQERAKDISTNQYQKRVEHFMANWANKALRMYVNSMNGTHKLTVDEETRRKLNDIERMDLVDGDKVSIDFSKLGTDMLQFQVRTGSLTQRKEDKERQGLQEMMLPVTQNLAGWSEENKTVVENEILLPALKRMLELSDTDIGQTLAGSVGDFMAKRLMAEIQGQLDGQQQQLDAQGAAIEGIAGALPPEALQAPLAQGVSPAATDSEAPAPASLPPGPGMEGTSPSSPSMPGLEESAGQQVSRPADLIGV